MKVSFFKYRLHLVGKTTKPPREGVLLRVIQQDGVLGYADCHPWSELGDVPLDIQLALLAKGETTSLTKQSLMFAHLDGHARAMQKNLFSGMPLPQNHFHISDQNLLSENLLKQLSKQGFLLIKVKAGLDFQSDCEMIKTFSRVLQKHHLKLRLDFNCRLSQSQFLEFLKKCENHLELIDYFEDPFSYDPISWQQIRESKCIQLACDKDSLQALDHPDSCDFLVVKPAIQDASIFASRELKKRLLVFTSYLDHPMGQLSGLYAASSILKNRPEIVSNCGFLTHHAYQPTEFSRAFEHANTQLIPSLNGFGFGYDHILNQCEWTELL